MRKTPTTIFFAATIALLTLTGASLVLASDHDLPAGPIHDRHELMEGIGKSSKVIGDALKSGDLAPVADAAEKIHVAAGKVLPLFPKGSTHPESRALDAIWTDWEKFEKINKEFEASAGELAKVAKSGGDVPAAAKAMFGSCKSCHESFRKPDEDEAH